MGYTTKQELEHSQPMCVEFFIKRNCLEKAVHICVKASTINIPAWKTQD